MNTSAQELAYLPLDKIGANRNNCRLHFAERDLNTLAESIRQVGVLEPVIVMSEPGHSYSIIAGERRCIAARTAGLTRIPAVVMSKTHDIKVLELSLIENLCRKGINPIEEAKAYRQLMNCGQSEEQIARKVGKAQETISNRVRLLQLPEDVQQLVATGKLSPSHARAMIPHSNDSAALRDLLNLSKSGCTSKQVEAASSREVESKRASVTRSPRTVKVKPARTECIHNEKCTLLRDARARIAELEEELAGIGMAVSGAE
ncbi:MAG: ParB/RepB/Spo0J family partition protein [Armatimonadota bacterium]